MTSLRAPDNGAPSQGLLLGEEERRDSLSFGMPARTQALQPSFNLCTAAGLCKTNILIGWLL